MFLPEALINYRCPDWNDFPDIELYMDQVISILEKYLSPFSEEKVITSTMINNYVKQKIIPPPRNKKYTREHLTHLFMICALKRFMQLSDICPLLENLEKGRSPAESYGLFKQELEGAMHLIFTVRESNSAQQEADAACVLKSACIAFGSICYSRFAFLSANMVWEQEKAAKRKKEEQHKKAEEKKKK